MRKVDTRIPRARRLRRDMTIAERKLWQRLRAITVEGMHFRRQATIGPYYADFACHEQKLIIEIDGGQHTEADQIERDERRSVFLASRGYRVLRFWNDDVLGNIDGVMSVIVEALDAAAAPTPDPSPPFRCAQREEGNASRAVRANPEMRSEE